MRRTPWIAVTVVLALTLAACDEEIVDPGVGGSQTALLRAEAYIAWTKLAACGGDTALMGLLAEDYLQFDSMPITDGMESMIAIGGNLALGDVLAARDCADVRAGVNYGVDPAACAPGGEPACVDGFLQACTPFDGDGALIVTDCERYDMTCAGGACRPDACAGAACEGDALVTCGPGGERRVFDCGALGLTCGHGGDGLQCVGAGNVCSVRQEGDDETDTSIAPHCEEHTLVWCLGGREARVDCAGRTDGRRRCSQAWLDKNPDVAPDDILLKHLTKACGPVGTDCEDGLTLCDGNDLKICIDGFFEYLDCRAYRFAGCLVASDGARCDGFPRP
jgi:hypothetical protein